MGDQLGVRGSPSKKTANKAQTITRYKKCILISSVPEKWRNKKKRENWKQNSKPKHNLGSTCASHFMQISKRTGAVPESTQCKYIEVKGHLEQTFTESKGSKMEIQQQK